MPLRKSEKKILGDIANHQGGFSVIQDILPVIPQDKLKTWGKSLKFESIFDGVHTDDENFVKGGHDKRRYQSKKVKADKILPELEIDELNLFFMALGFEEVNDFKVLKSPGFPDPVHQAPHRDYGTPADFFHNSGAVNGCVCSAIASLMGMELDIWRTVEAYRLRKEEGPRQGSPTSVPHLTVRLPPGAIILFRFDLWHAGRGYHVENYRLFMTCIPARGASKVDPRTEETFFNRCVCQQEIYDKAAVMKTPPQVGFWFTTKNQKISYFRHASVRPGKQVVKTTTNGAEKRPQGQIVY